MRLAKRAQDGAVREKLGQTIVTLVRSAGHAARARGRYLQFLRSAVLKPVHTTGNSRPSAERGLDQVARPRGSHAAQGRCDPSPQAAGEHAPNGLEHIFTMPWERCRGLPTRGCNGASVADRASL